MRRWFAGRAATQHQAESPHCSEYCQEPQVTELRCSCHACKRMSLSAHQRAWKSKLWIRGRLQARHAACCTAGTVGCGCTTACKARRTLQRLPAECGSIIIRKEAGHSVLHSFVLEYMLSTWRARRAGASKPPQVCAGCAFSLTIPMCLH